jgi:uncharacterized protein (TIGR00375 family)
MQFIGDFHIHSHYSLATSKELVPEYLDYWARVKGIKVVGTGDFTHPGWLKELREKLEPAEEGLFKLKEPYKLNHAIHGFAPANEPVRFILTTEISNIYKKDGKVRKIHNIVFAPSFEIAESIQQALLARNFNITSDGRPILGLDAKDLLDLCLNVSQNIFFVPAHIWTPWFSVLGAKSGFDTVEACYEELSEHIFAVETGLSSDPPMNWVISSLDKYTLIANSDAHSPEKLGRNANVFNTDVSYPAIIDAMKTGEPDKFRGTIDFFPQEGKYHFDGHRKCNICWDPSTTLEHKGLCPVCGKRITVGVMHRVAELADRPNPGDRPNALPFHSLIPLKEILSEILNAGSNSKKIALAYSNILQKAGTEFNLLLNEPPEHIAAYGGDLLGLAVDRMRKRQVIIREGYDGEYGVVKALDDEEKKYPEGQELLFGQVQTKQIPERPLIPFDIAKFEQLLKAGYKLAIPEKNNKINPLKGFNAEQKAAVEHFKGPALIMAGPGTGKTSVLTNRIARLIDQKKVTPANILAVTFTNKAADEMKKRLAILTGDKDKAERIQVCTFHALGHELIKKAAGMHGFTIIDAEEKKKLLIKEADVSKPSTGKMANKLSAIKQQLIFDAAAIKDKAMRELFERYTYLQKKYNILDLDDLMYKAIAILKDNTELLEQYKQQFQYILVDEYQDVNYAQYQFIRLLKPDALANLFVIGDPNQAVYGFRGADVRYINQFRDDYPNAEIYHLKKSYRCSDKILQASEGIIKSGASAGMINGLQKGIKINIVHHPTDKSEAEFIARKIEDMIGGLRFFSIDSGVTGGEGGREINSLSDFAILCRSKIQIPVIQKALNDHAIPHQIVGDEPCYRQSPIREVVEILELSIIPDNHFLKHKLREKVAFDDTGLNTISNMIKDSTIEKVLQYIIGKYFPKFQETHADQLKKLLDKAKTYGTNAIAFISQISTGTVQDDYDPENERVAVMTMHASKGLEFKCVFITGCEDGLIPFSLFDDQKCDPEEEKRLLYVGMTRAEQFLYITHAQKRFLHGREYRLHRSPFLDSIEQELTAESKSEHKKKQPEEKQLRLF